MPSRNLESGEFGDRAGARPFDSGVARVGALRGSPCRAGADVAKRHWRSGRAYRSGAEDHGSSRASFAVDLVSGASCHNASLREARHGTTQVRDGTRARPWREAATSREAVEGGGLADGPGRASDSPRIAAFFRDCPFGWPAETQNRHSTSRRWAGWCAVQQAIATVTGYLKGGRATRLTARAPC